MSARTATSVWLAAAANFGEPREVYCRRLSSLFFVLSAASAGCSFSSSGQADGSTETSSEGTGETSASDTALEGGDAETTTAGDGDASSGDGDASGDDSDASSGDGDAETSTGDGDASGDDSDASTGDGDAETSTGDGDAETSTGDGDATTGDGDGDGYYGACPSGDDAECLSDETCIIGSLNGIDWSICVPSTCNVEADCDFAPDDLCDDLPGDGVAIDYCLPLQCSGLTGCPSGMVCVASFYQEDPDICLWPLP